MKLIRGLGRAPDDQERAPEDTDGAELGMVTAGASSPRGPRVFEYRLVPVEYSDPVAEALRSAMAAEMRLRYWDRLTHGSPIASALEVDSTEVVWTAVVWDSSGLPAGHTLLRRYRGRTDELELKRMYVTPAHRGTGVAQALLRGVDAAAQQSGARQIVLQTGDRQPDAVRMYRRHGYVPIPLLDDYVEMPYSICLSKTVTHPSTVRLVDAAPNRAQSTRRAT